MRSLPIYGSMIYDVIDLMSMLSLRERTSMENLPRRPFSDTLQDSIAAWG